MLLAQASAAQEIKYTKVTLDNGLDVIIHEDHSDPIVAIYVSYHVGSGREEVGRSGFAHLFEHMLFQGSQHVGDDQHFKLISEAGGSLNGTTNLDRTLYFETLPSNHLELGLWLEADRMGFLLPAVTRAKLDNQRDVVKNERRQNYENRPYAQAEGALVAAMYPPDHPYSWTTIGSQEDLTAASLEDVHNFFRRWYGPNNATLAIGGDVNPEKTIEIVKKYFGSIPRGPRVDPPAKRYAQLDQSKRIVLEDKVQLPQVILAWPTVDNKHEDDAPLSLLASILAEGKSSLMEKAFRIDTNLARNVSASNESAEIAGHFTVTLTASPEAGLDELEIKSLQLLNDLAAKGVDPAQLERAKTRLESRFVRRMETVGSKTSSLAVANMFTGDPNDAAKELKKTLSVTPDRIIAVLKKYILQKPNIVVSVVPEGKIQLAATGRSAEQLAAEKTFDRRTKPEAGPRPSIAIPKVWRDQWSNGVQVTATKYAEIPLTSLSLSIPAGRSSEPIEKNGLASLAAACMNEGTKKLTSTELSEALESLGATINVSSDDDDITVSLSVLNKNLPAAVEIFKDVITSPRFDAKDFARLKKQRLLSIRTRGENIRGIASTVWSRLMYGDRDPLGLPGMGTQESIEKLTLDDILKFHRECIAPHGAQLTFAGEMEQSAVRELFKGLSDTWTGAVDGVARATPAAGDREATTKTTIYLVDKPGAAQSEVRIGHKGVTMSDPDQFPLTVLNYILGGAFSSRINMNLREEKGYTYGARSSFDAGLKTGTFSATGGIHTQYTKEAVEEFMKELRRILEGVTEEELAFAKNALAQNYALQYESAMARLGMLRNISKYQFKDDYPAARLARLEQLTTADLKALAQKYIHPDAMTILVVGDRAKVLDGLSKLGFGTPTELDIDGAPKK